MIEHLKTELDSKGYCLTEIENLFPDLNLNDFSALLNDSWTQEKSTYWEYHNVILGATNEDIPHVVALDDLPARRELIKDLSLTVDQQYFQLNLDPNYFSTSLKSFLRSLLIHLYPVAEDEDYFLNDRINCLSHGDFISPQTYEDKLCHVLLFLSDVDTTSAQGGELRIRDQELMTKKGTLLIVDAKNNKFSVGIKPVYDSVPRFIFRCTVNLYKV